jgi:uncharacterized protein (TIGR03083 family)
MDLWTIPAMDVRPALIEERRDLLDLLGGLSDDEWFAPTEVPGWSVKDLALHILDDDLGWLSRGRDSDPSGRLDADAAGFVTALNQKNDDWVRATRQLSRPVVVGLLEWAGQQMDDYYASQSLTNEGRVAWASNQPVPNWFDIAQGLTERWVHQMQMREAICKVGTYRDDYLPEVMQTFVWAFPHQYRPEAPEGTRVFVSLGTEDRWTLTRAATRWTLTSGQWSEEPAAQVMASPDGGWKWLTGGIVSSDDVETKGPSDLCGPLMEVRAILV